MSDTTQSSSTPDTTVLVFADPSIALAVSAIKAKLKSYELIPGDNQTAAAALQTFSEVEGKLFRLGA